MKASVEDVGFPPIEEVVLPPGPSPPASQYGTSKRAFFGTIALSVANSARLVLQVVMLPILARMLGPAAFGLVSLAMPFIVFANMLSDAGMGNALIRQRDPSLEVESTVFWFTVGIGSAIALALCAGSSVLALILRQPQLAPVMIALSPILVLSSSLSVSNARISRNRHFDLFAVGDFLSTILSSGSAIIAALKGYGAWSLVIQQLVLWVTKTCWILAASRFRPRLIFRPSLARPFMSFGLNSVAADLSDFVAKGAPALIVGSVLGVVAVGHYAMAYQLVRIPEWILAAPLYLATFTAVAGLADQPARASQLSLRAVRMVATVVAPLFIGLALVADLLIGIFLGPKWLPAAPALSLLAFGGLFLCLYSVIGAVLMGLGRADLQLRLSLACGIAMIGGVVIGCRFGLTAAAFGLSAGAALVFPLYARALGSQLMKGAGPIISTIGRPLIATAVMAGAVLLVRQEVTGWAPVLRLAASVLTGVLAFLVALAMTAGRQLLEDIKQTLPRRSRPQEVTQT